MPTLRDAKPHTSDGAAAADSLLRRSYSRQRQPRTIRKLCKPGWWFADSCIRRNPELLPRRPLLRNLSTLTRRTQTSAFTNHEPSERRALAEVPRLLVVDGPAKQKYRWGARGGIRADGS